MAGIVQYLEALERALARGDATEHTHRPALKSFVEAQLPGAVATNEPRRQKAGAPDFVVSQGHAPLGYIEAKDIGVGLDGVLATEQLARYLEGLRNLILTDYLEFRWFVDGQQRAAGTLAQWDGANLQPDEEGIREVEYLFEGFGSTVAATISEPSTLAKRMASLARQMRHVMINALLAEREYPSDRRPLHDQFDAFRSVLLHDLAPTEFADMYAQTITYGLFAARAAQQADDEFSRHSAAYLIPRTNPFLRQLFSHMAGPNLDNSADWIVDDLVQVLLHADMAAILSAFGSRSSQQDPVIHFYETFLAQYDPGLRNRRGVYYTPEPVVYFIVESVDHLLEQTFGLSEGLADTSRTPVPDARDQDSSTQPLKHRVQLLDPAAGTGTFLFASIDKIYERVVGGHAGNRGMWPGYVRDHLLPRLNGFELLMAPYTVAHMKLSLQLAEMGYDVAEDERLRIFLTNTLERPHEFTDLPLFGRYLARETEQAGDVKTDVPVLVVLGNPPYAGHSANANTWIAELVNAYRYVDGERVTLRQGKWLQNDYVKFIRFAQWRINETGQGIVAFITDNSYLVGETFVGMRKSLLDDFSDIYIIDLHGNTNKRERTPEGNPDGNVFAIKQGVAIVILVKRSDADAGRPAAVHHVDRWGSTEAKYDWLTDNHVGKVDDWTAVEPQSPLYLFKPLNTDREGEFSRGFSLSEMVDSERSIGPGIITTHDQFAISMTPDVQRAKIRQLITSRDEREARTHFRLCSQDQWNYDVAKAWLSRKPWEQDLFQVLYRPFDVRWSVYSPHVAVHRRDRSSRHMLMGPNLGLVTNRVVNGAFTHVTCTRYPIDNSTLSTESRERSYLVPLYLYPEGLYDEPTDGIGGRRPNLSLDFVHALEQATGLSFVTDGAGDLEETVGPEDVFAYVYSLLHSNAYRIRYADLLKSSFPRVPITANRELLEELVRLGRRLVELHLMDARAPDPPGFPQAGSNVVAAVSFEADEGSEHGRIHINPTQYFDRVERSAWEYRVGAYPALQKWLEGRTGTALAYEDLVSFERIAAALATSARVADDIDEAIDSHGGFPLN